MNSIINKLKSLTTIELYDENQQNYKNMLFSDATFNFLNDDCVYNLNEYTEDSTFENVDVYTNELGKLTIFQDYGNDINVRSGYDYIPYQLVLPDNNKSSLGYYNGKFVYIIISNNYMRIYDLFEKELPDLSTLNYKRPYTFSIVTDGVDIYYQVSLNLDDYFEYLYKTDKKLTSILTLDNINKVLDGTKNSVQYDNAVSKHKYITRDYLVKQGFSYNNKVWYKNGISLEDWGGDVPFIVKYNNDYIFEIKDLENLLGTSNI